MRSVVLIALMFVVTGCTSVTYNCNVPGSCPAAPKAGVSVRLDKPVEP
ncbi:MAG TPA: hypothetical protein VHN73_05360 [Phenylobacterium sp.]|nr:hypothetical protein [Phenylobacterium sp.]